MSAPGLELTTLPLSKTLDKKLQPDVSSLPTPMKEIDVEQLAPIEFPEGGWRAWSSTAGAFLFQFTSFGYISSFGVYQDYYVREYLQNFSTSQIGWIGGIQIFLNYTTGVISGRLFDRGYFNHLVVSTILLYSIALFMLSVSHPGSYYQVFLTNGVALSLASGLTYLPSLAVVTHYFDRKRLLALGIASSGSAFGALIHPILLNKLINGPIGFHNAVRISAAMNVSLLLVAFSITRTRLPPKEKAVGFPIKKWLRQPAYICIVLSGIPFFLGLFYVPFYIQLNAITNGIPTGLAFYSVSILNASSIIGRILPSVFSQRFGIFNMDIFFTIGTGVVILSSIAVKDFTGTVLLGIFFGIFSGACFSLTNNILAQIADHPNEVGTRVGIYIGFGGLVGLFANPILGALVTDQFNWVKPAILSGVCMTSTGIIYIIARHYAVKRYGPHKV